MLHAGFLFYELHSNDLPYAGGMQKIIGEEALDADWVGGLHAKDLPNGRWDAT